jgi:hypothetical protein
VHETNPDVGAHEIDAEIELDVSPNLCSTTCSQFPNPMGAMHNCFKITRYGGRIYLNQNNYKKRSSFPNASTHTSKVAHLLREEEWLASTSFQR